MVTRKLTHRQQLLDQARELRHKLAEVEAEITDLTRPHTGSETAREAVLRVMPIGLWMTRKSIKLAIPEKNPHTVNSAIDLLCRDVVLIRQERPGLVKRIR